MSAPQAQPASPPATLADLRRLAERELLGDILPFWSRHAFDPRTGNLVGMVTNDLRTYDNGPRHAVLCSRVLWAFAAGAQVDPAGAWLVSGRKAFTLLDTSFWDQKNGGVYWSIDAAGQPLSDRKQVYAQAFAIYGLTEWYAATGEKPALARAQEIFHLLEKHARDRSAGGYTEALSREWNRVDDMRLSPGDLNAPKSMNTMLHVLEAYTRLARVSPDPELHSALKALLTVFIERIYTDAPFPHLALFFDLKWRSLNDVISYGHDIEASWLLGEAAEVVGDPALSERVKTVALRLARSVLDHGVDRRNGSVFYEGGPEGVNDSSKSWWVQAEAVVGFLNAWQTSGDETYQRAALRTWGYIEANVIDRKNGEWFSTLSRGGPGGDYPTGGVKIGPWKCPYHNARATIEVMRRIPQ
jgi:mannobiose 2-epimerase